MKKISIVILIISIAAIIFTACGWQKKDDVPNVIIDAVEDMHDNVKKNIKDITNATENNHTASVVPTKNP